MPTAYIESIDNEGRGVAHVDGKAIFVEGGITGELVEYSTFRKKPNYELATLSAVAVSSSQRVSPGCPNFGVCGGCSLQHVNPYAQTAIKQRVLEDALWFIGRLRPEVILPPISGKSTGYRYRARLSVRFVPKKGGMLVGFHEKRSSYVAIMDSCEVLPKHVSALIPALKELLLDMSLPNRLPQIEVSIGHGQTALVLRHLEQLTDVDHQRLRDFSDAEGIVWYLQPKGPDSAYLFYPADAPPLHYSLPEFNLKLGFGPTDFIQVNHGVNTMLVRRAIRLLAPSHGDRVADLFCGLGNFTLPIARGGAFVVGIEGSPTLVAQAKENAERNGLTTNCGFEVANLFDIDEASFSEVGGKYGPFNKMLIDPPRDGAIELVKSLPVKGPLQRIVYVSCNPSTLARDAAVLCFEKGFVLKEAGIASMFPHTSHVESIALFERYPSIH